MKIKGFEDYEIFDDGKVYSCKSSKFLIPQNNGNGYLKVNLYKNGGNFLFRISKELCNCGRQKSQVAKTCFECRKNRVKRICRYCKKEYECKASLNKTYCSRNCRYADTETNKKMHSKQKKRTKVKCLCCGREKLIVKSKANRVKRGNFCNSKCFYRYNRGANSSSWKGGISSERASLYATHSWRNAIKFVWKRDNATCQRCNESFQHKPEQQFHIHHIKSFKHKELRCDISNLVLLCKVCHRWVHSKKNQKGEFLLSDE